MINELSIVVPCISTTESLPSFIDELAKYLMNNPSEVDVIIVMNERVLDPETITTYIRDHYPWLKYTVLQRSGMARNYGALVRFGIAYSTSQYVVLVSPYGDDDLSIINFMLAKIREGAQVVQATRYTNLEDTKQVAGRFRLYQYIYRALTRLFLKHSISDSTYAFKMFDRTFVQALGLTHNGYSVCPEITLKTILAGGRVDYIPSTTRTTIANKDFKLYKEGLGYFWLLVRGALHRIGIVWF